MDKKADPPTTKDKIPDPDKRTPKTPEWVKGTIEPTTKK